MVAGSLVRECAVINLQELALAASDSPACPSHKADLSHDVYAQYIYVEGVRYIQALSNVSSSKIRRRKRVFNAQHRLVVQNIYVRYDHLGIRDIWFTLPKTLLLRSLGAGRTWWTELSRKDGIRQVTASTDVRLL